MTRQEQIQEELAWADHYALKAQREKDPHMKAEWEAQAQTAREQAERLQAPQEAITERTLDAPGGWESG